LLFHVAGPSQPPVPAIAIIRPHHLPTIAPLFAVAFLLHFARCLGCLVLRAFAAASLHCRYVVDRRPMRSKPPTPPLWVLCPPHHRAPEHSPSTIKRLCRRRTRARRQRTSTRRCIFPLRRCCCRARVGVARASRLPVWFCSADDARRSTTRHALAHISATKRWCHSRALRRCSAHAAAIHSHVPPPHFLACCRRCFGRGARAAPSSCRPARTQTPTCTSAMRPPPRPSGGWAQSTVLSPRHAAPTYQNQAMSIAAHKPPRAAAAPLRRPYTSSRRCNGTIPPRRCPSHVALFASRWLLLLPASRRRVRVVPAVARSLLPSAHPF